MLISDDHGRADVGAYGSALVQTPSIDTLSQEGLLFTHATAPSPSCVPSRGTLFTGLYPHSSGIIGQFPDSTAKPGLATLPTLLQSAGYRTYLVGKDHLRPREAYSFDHVEELGGGYTRSKPSPEEYAMAARAALQDANGRPFLMVVGLRDAHRPFPSSEAATLDPQAVQPPPFLFDTRAIRGELVRYYEAVARLDRSVGLVLAELENAGRASETIVIFTSDSGPSFPFAKTTLYDAGIRVPFLLRWPGVVTPGSSEGASISFVDVLPTILEAVGRSDLLPANAEGLSFLPLLLGETQEGRSEVIGTITEVWPHRLHPSRSIRTDRYKYIYNFPMVDRFRSEAQRGATWRSMRQVCRHDPAAEPRCDLYRFRPREELYDLETDPSELSNLADDPVLAPVKQDLKTRLRDWMAAHADPWLAQWPP
jgi:N-sulfoglucosamine sulfohydrolase